MLAPERGALVAITETLDVDLRNWSMSGSYFEACNCEAICPCRKVGDVAGGGSTYGSCDFALSWHIEDGHAGNVDLGGLDVVMAGQFLDDPALAGERGSAWTVALYIDERADDEQGAALEAILLGRAGGSTLQNFAAAIGDVRAVRRARIHLEHAHGRQRVEVPDHVRIVARQPVASAEPVSCGIPGHDHPGQEWIADLGVHEDGLTWDVTGRCAFAARFDYRSGTA